ncbi:MAG: heme NO-binding domain-containing protein [Candidatus Marinimicrobia bacterium]|nr:heme NO-binding domain-containing protein [Candidatus Neomarinimicrobiota bacterium]MBL7047063.1 heme NO-binding domain-containing protein [Candidatus Neomarinimicrobiota bacterium]
MKGIIFNLLEDFIIESLGEEQYEDILGECELQTDEPFVGPGTYPDEDLLAIVNKAVEALGITLPEALRAFGKFCIPKLTSKFPDFMTPHKHPKSFLKTIDTIHHVEVKKLMADAEVPHFSFEEPADDRLILRYHSKRKFCHLMEGLIEGVADYYGSPIQQKQSRCMLEGDDFCEFDLKFSTKEK